MEGKGLNVVDLGVDVDADKFVNAAKDNDADIIACSALLTTTMGEMKNVVEKLKEENLSGKIKVMIGGAPVTQNYCDSIGADYYTSDAASASDVAYQICTPVSYTHLSGNPDRRNHRCLLKRYGTTAYQWYC